jgi:hypothetical protein
MLQAPRRIEEVESEEACWDRPHRWSRVSQLLAGYPRKSDIVLYTTLLDIVNDNEGFSKGYKMPCAATRKDMSWPDVQPCPALPATRVTVLAAQFYGEK